MINFYRAWFSSTLTSINAEKKSLSMKKRETLTLWPSSNLKSQRQRHWICLNAIPRTYHSSQFVLNLLMMLESACLDLMGKWEYVSLNSIFSKSAFTIQRDSLNSKLWQPLDKESQRISMPQLSGKTISIDVSALVNHPWNTIPKPI